jgi:DsbC/DsbD-like thiol-disulfide interchange protein
MITASALTLILSLAFGVSAAAQKETRHLKVTTSVSPAVAEPGSRVSLLVDVAPKPSMHVYSPLQTEYIPISLVLEPHEAVTAHVARFPKPEKIRVLDEPQLVYSRPFRIIQHVTVTRTPAVLERARATGATVTVKGSLKYQACDDMLCYAPVTMPVAWTIELKQPGKVNP